MAEIKLQKKPVMPWWLWLIAAILLIALIWWAVQSFGDDESELAGADEDVIAGAPLAPGTGVGDGLDQASGAAGAGAGSAATAGAGEPITDIATVLNATEPAALVGRPIRLEGVRMQEMVGDATFWVGPSGDRRVFVVLDEQIPSPPPTVEGRVNVNVGQTVNLQGVIRRADDLPGGDVLDEQERRIIGGQPIYVWAQDTNVATPAGAAPAGPPGVTSN